VRQRQEELHARRALLRPLARQSGGLRPRLLETDRRLRWLQFLDRVPGAGIYIVGQAAVPQDSVAPRIVRDVIAASLLGFLIGLTPWVTRTSWRSIFRLRSMRP
jgi:hypothetical protein